MDAPFSQPSQAEEKRNWLPIAAGAVIVVVLLAAIVIFGGGAKQAAAPTQGPPPYSEYLKFGDLKLSAAQNFVGGTVTYLDGKITNAGSQTVTGASVEVIFRNSLGEVVQKELQPLMLLHTGPGYPDVVGLATVPLLPNQTREFRLTFEHISADWNQGYPELRLASVNTK